MSLDRNLDIGVLISTPLMACTKFTKNDIKIFIFGNSSCGVKAKHGRKAFIIILIEDEIFKNKNTLFQKFIK